MKQIYLSLLCFSILFFTSCASHLPKFLDADVPKETANEGKEIAKTFYLIGDAGAAKDEESSAALKAFDNLVKDKDTKDDYVIYLGDNIYPAGLPDKGEKGRETAKKLLDAQLDATNNFDGVKLFIPGNHDWYSDGLNGLKRQENYIEKALDDNDAFQPEKGCPIEMISVSDDIELMVLDTQWFITDWDKHPTINDNCEIKSRKAFFLEIENELKKNNEKTILIAMHHPTFTYGLHGGYFNFQKHIFASGNKIPIPGLASLVTLIRSQGGVSPQDRYNNRYNELMKRLITLATDSDRVVFASGHEHTLQYIENSGIKQIVSGSGSKDGPVALGKGAKFVYGGRGFAVFNVYEDSSSDVIFYAASEDGKAKEMYRTAVHKASQEYDTSDLPKSFKSTIDVSAYEKEATEKSGRYEWFWGDHYRYIYGTKIKVPVATLDTLMGGMTIERKGGGHQTRSLRLNDPNKKNYALRAVNKSAVQFLQSVAFTDTYIQDDFRETLTEDVIRDFYTSSHPYAAFVIGDLSDAIGLYHTNPQLFYMPKHEALGKYNESYGDELYIMEERPDDGFLDVPSFGNPDGIESTSDVLKNLRKDEKYKMDEAAFIKARLFDMLVGDWDRHQDQWRWARFDSDGESIYRPIPRDRDQVFSNYDGALFSILNTIMPSTKQFQVYDDELKNIKWINLAGIKIDRTFTQTSDLSVWVEQAKFIQENLTDEAIDKAFLNLPSEVQDDTSNDIKAKLKARRGHLEDIARRYFKRLNNLVVITGTDKDDYIEITRTRNETTVSISRIKDGEVQPPFRTRSVNHKETDEIWVYGLDDDDQFVIKGKGNNPTMVRVVGGQNNDIYDVEGGRKIKIYDHKSKPNTIAKAGTADFKFKDNYRYNVYRYDKYIDKVSTIIPGIGFNPDDGMRVGLTYSSAKKGFKNDPFQVKHTFGGGYYFATQGFDLMYEGEFATFFDTWNILVGGSITSENFTQNFFGFGNETENFDDVEGLDFNRVKTASRIFKVGTVKDGHYGSRIEITGGIESIEVEETPNRFIAQAITAPDFFGSRKIFGNFDFTYSYSGFDNAVSPTRGMFFEVKTGAKMNLENTERTFGFVNPSLEFYNALTRNRKLVLK